MTAPDNDLLPCGHPAGCLRQHGPNGSSCGWCVDVLALAAAEAACEARVLDATQTVERASHSAPLTWHEAMGVIKRMGRELDAAREVVACRHLVLMDVEPPQNRVTIDGMRAWYRDRQKLEILSIDSAPAPAAPSTAPSTAAAPVFHEVRLSDKPQPPRVRSPSEERAWKRERRKRRK